MTFAFITGKEMVSLKILLKHVNGIFLLQLKEIMMPRKRCPTLKG